MDKWYNKSGNEGDVVISTRIRFARNLKEYPFPCRLNDETKCKVTALVKDAILNGNSALASRFEYIQMPELTQEEAVSLVERHLVSPEFISDSYDIFYDELLPSIQRIHGKTVHIGKLAKSAGSEVKMKSTLAKLKEELTTAIKEQEFEKAAKLRDQIKELEAKG